MNSYYTNRIEGQHTRPADIERALRNVYAADTSEARKQRLALAHIGAEIALERMRPAEAARCYEPDYLRAIHAALYERLPAEERVADDGAPIEPGALRTSDVIVGHHLPPPHASVAPLLAAWQAAYAPLPGRELALVGAACAHHRLAWIHPFADGNGRTARLHTYLVLGALGVRHDVWSPLRGMARARDTYYARLHSADLPRRNDLDGRGSLSEEELVAFAAWLLDVCLDQVTFMQGLLDLWRLRDGLRDLLAWLAASPWPIGAETSVIKPDALEPLHYVALTGALDRARFLAMTGLPGRTARRVLASLLDFGLLSSTGPKAPVAFALPYPSLRFLFPRLWPEAEADFSGPPSGRR
jgi:Fic family protein